MLNFKTDKSITEFLHIICVSKFVVDGSISSSSGPLNQYLSTISHEIVKRVNELNVFKDIAKTRFFNRLKDEDEIMKNYLLGLSNQERKAYLKSFFLPILLPEKEMMQILGEIA